MSPASFLISYNIVILHFVKNERSSYMHALRAYFYFLRIFTSLIFFTHPYLFVTIYIYANSTSYI